MTSLTGANIDERASERECTLAMCMGTSVARIGRWDGSAWNQLGSGMDGDVLALATLANGDVVAAGAFTTAGGVTCNGIASWNGSSWSALGTGLGNRDGENVGPFVGRRVGVFVGRRVGVLVGRRVGVFVGRRVGVLVGRALGTGLGRVVGAAPQHCGSWECGT